MIFSVALVAAVFADYEAGQRLKKLRGYGAVAPWMGGRGPYAGRGVVGQVGIRGVDLLPNDVLHRQPTAAGARVKRILP